MDFLDSVMKIWSLPFYHCDVCLEIRNIQTENGAALKVRTQAVNGAPSSHPIQPRNKQLYSVYKTRYITRGIQMIVGLFLRSAQPST